MKLVIKEIKVIKSCMMLSIDIVDNCLCIISKADGIPVKTATCLRANASTMAK